MTALAFETFTPDAPTAENSGEIAAIRAEFERRIAEVRGEARAAGFEEGAAKAAAAADSELAMVLSSIAERLQDGEFARSEVELRARTAMAQFAAALIAGIAPAAARAGLAAEVADAVDDALRREPSARPVVTVSPSAAPRVADALAAAGLAADVRADPELDALAADVSWAGGVDAINLAACVDAAHAVISAHVAPREENRRHG